MSDDNEGCGCFEEFGDLVLNVGREHYGICMTHNYYWSIGSNLFSAWRDETEEIWQRNAERLRNDYAELPGWMAELVEQDRLAIVAASCDPADIPY